MNNKTDDELIDIARAGDKNALNFLMKKYKLLANKIARSYFLIGAESEDLLQEAMIGLFNAYKYYDKKTNASFATFAHTCITRSVQTAVKGANRKKHQILNQSLSLTNQGGVIKSNDAEDEDINLVLPSNVLSPDEKLIEKETLENIKNKIISVLSKKELIVLALFLKGYSYTKIATTLQTSNKSIDNALSRIRKKLQFLKQ